jgi:hypothetical protein
VDDQYLPEFGGAYLEDSYFLGLVAEGRNLRLTFLFALTADHPDYRPPRTGEQHCYRQGSIIVEAPSIVDWQPLLPTVTQDVDGMFDFGSIELYRRGPNRFRFVTQWFDTTVEAAQLHLRISDPYV